MCDCEHPKFFSQKIRTARKTHECCECPRPINLGDKYTHSPGKWDNHVGSYKTCLECEKIRAWFDRKTDCCAAFGELYTELVESDIIALIDPDDDGSLYQVVDFENEIEITGNSLRIKNE
jgi:hypothetical protein